MQKGACDSNGISRMNIRSSSRIGKGNSTAFPIKGDSLIKNNNVNTKQLSIRTRTTRKMKHNMPMIISKLPDCEVRLIDCKLYPSSSTRLKLSDVQTGKNNLVETDRRTHTGQNITIPHGFQMKLRSRTIKVHENGFQGIRTKRNLTVCEQNTPCPTKLLKKMTGKCFEHTTCEVIDINTPTMNRQLISRAQDVESVKENTSPSIDVQVLGESKDKRGKFKRRNTFLSSVATSEKFKQKKGGNTKLFDENNENLIVKKNLTKCKERKKVKPKVIMSSQKCNTVLKNIGNYNKMSSPNLIKDKSLDKTKKKSLLNINDSFEEYGMVLPSFDKILDSYKKIQADAEALDEYEKLYKNIRFSLPDNLKNINMESLSKESVLLDCKHLSIEQLEKYFYNNKNYIENIMKGIAFSERHSRYWNYDPKNSLTMNDLTYSASIVVFTDNQRDYLIHLLEKSFDIEGHNTEYIFKVLLPELCFEIFRSEHHMTNQDATEYLDWRPVE